MANFEMLAFGTGLNAVSIWPVALNRAIFRLIGVSALGKDPTTMMLPLLSWAKPNICPVMGELAPGLNAVRTEPSALSQANPRICDGTSLPFGRTTTALTVPSADNAPLKVGSGGPSGMNRA